MSYGRRVPDGPEAVGIIVQTVGVAVIIFGWPTVGLVVTGIVLLMVGGIIGSA